MTHKYKVTGITCSGCEAKVKSSLLMLPNITNVDVSKEQQTVAITMDKHIALSVLQNALDKKYTISTNNHSEAVEQTKNWFNTYKPILIIFMYIFTISIIVGAQHSKFHWMQAMNVFMAGFFLTFSFFKFLDLKGFAESYSMYDVIAKKIPVWGYVYAFIELTLGIAYAINFQPIETNIATLAIMTISIVGVLQSVFNKRKIKCACLGAVFNLPMSSITIIEDALMIVMSAVMLVKIL
ncbi:MAG: heavy-metal-associated domain-containing protein [Chitinophagaceae bacterium]|nr:heavy-metal-associated domain-containing protein [Chitinophagaceae bacterium]